MDESASYEMAITKAQIIRMMGICEAKFDKVHRDRMLSAGAIFKVRKGRPPRIHIMGFPSLVQRYISLQASEGQTI